MTNENDKPAASEPPASVVTLHGDRTQGVPIQYPAEFEGVVYDKVVVRRPTRAEVQTFVDGGKLPIYDIPEVVFENLDPDDFERVNEVMLDFLPLSLQTALALARESGEDTSQPSQASLEAESSNTSE